MPERDLIFDKKERKRYLSSLRNKRWQERKAAAEAKLTEEVNKNRAELNLAPVTLKVEHKCPFKGKQRPTYYPPPEMLAKMSPEDVRQWRVDETKKRKAASQRLNRVRKKEMLKNMKHQLPLLQSKVKEMKQSNGVTRRVQLQNGPLVLKGEATTPQTLSGTARMDLKSEMVEVLESKAAKVEAQGSPGFEKVPVKGRNDFGFKHEPRSLDPAQVLVSSVEEWKDNLAIDTKPKTKPTEEMLGLREVAKPNTTVQINKSTPNETANQLTPPGFFVHQNTKIKTKFGYLLPVVLGPDDFGESKTN